MSKKINFSGIIKGIAFSLILTFIIMLAVAAICYYFTVSDKALSLVVLGDVCASVFVCAFAVSRKNESSGLLHGALIGFGYFAVTIISGITVNRGLSFDANFLSTLIVAVASGALGGIIGVN